MSSKSYVALEEVKASLELTGFSFVDGDLEKAISAATRMVDEFCGRTFWPPAAEDTFRYYTPQAQDLILIDDLQELTTLETDQDGDGVFETTWDVNTQFFLEPLNALADDRPYTKLALNVNVSSQGFPYWAKRSVKVTGKFGWAAVPENVVEATSILATRLMRRVREAPFGVVSVGLDGAVTRISKNDPDVVALLTDYVRELAN